jgi:hypothetical protein
LKSYTKVILKCKLEGRDRKESPSTRDIQRYWEFFFFEKESEREKKMLLNEKRFFKVSFVLRDCSKMEKKR